MKLEYMIFSQKEKGRFYFFLIVFLIRLTNFSSAQNTCPVSLNQWQWPTHTNWFYGWGNQIDFGAAGNDAISFGNFSVTTGAWKAKAYESTATASDNDGNLILATNGVFLWDKNGDEIIIPTGRVGSSFNSLLTGAEKLDGIWGSAVQGVMIVKHPLTLHDYYIFTTDDAINGENGLEDGFNYYVYNSVQNVITSGPIRLKDKDGDYFRSTEQVAATFHGNGIDIWISTHESKEGTKKYLSYLLTCSSGLNEIPVESIGEGFNVNAVGQGAAQGKNDNERASLKFSWDGTKAAATHHCGGGNYDPVNSVVIMDFDNLTGKFSNTMDRMLPDISPNPKYSNPYACEWSPDNTKVFVSFQCVWGSSDSPEIGYFDVVTGTYAKVANFNGSLSGGLKLGGDGKIYTGQIDDCNAPTYNEKFKKFVGVISNPNDGGTFSTIATQQRGGWGLGNMFIAPRDYVQIQDPGEITFCDLPIDLNTLWQCKVSSAENTPSYESAYSLATVGPNVCSSCIINDKTGVFNAPKVNGKYEVHFSICDIRDTLIFEVDICGCDARVGDASPICPGETFNLDNIEEGSSGKGVWTVDSVPLGSGIDAVIDDTGLDTLFDASDLNTKPGIYKVMFRVDDTCEDSVYIEVKTLPTVDVKEIGPFCDDSVKTPVIAIPALGGDVTRAEWIYSLQPPLPALLPYEFDPIIFGLGTHRIKYSVDSLGCSGIDSIDVLVFERPHPEIKPAGPFCANVSEYQLELVDAAVDSGVWSGEADTDGKFNPSTSLAGDHDVFYTINGLCGNDTTIKIHVDPFKDATITSSNDTLKICAFDPNPTFTVAQDGGSWIDDAGDPQVGVIQTTTDIEIDLNVIGAGLTNEMYIYVQGDPCGDKDTIWLTTTDKLDASITQVGPYCDSDNPVNLVVVDEGGIFSGDGITDVDAGVFSPIIAKDGTHRVTYTISGNCGDDKFIDIEVLRTPDPSITNTVFKFCEDHGDVTMTSTEMGGVWRAIDSDNGGLNPSTGVFNTVTSSHGSYRIEYGFAGQCSAYDTLELIIDQMPVITFVTEDGLLVCEDDAPFQVEVTTNPSNASLTWLEGTDASGEFTPAGNLYFNTILLEAENGLCSTDSAIIIGVMPEPNAEFASPPYFCIDDIAQPMLPVEEGGQWTSTAAGAIDVNTSVFDPAISGAGIHTITYKIPGQCEDSYSVDISVIAPPDPTIANPGNFCEGDPEFILEAASFGGVWVGDVNSDGSFNPEVNGEYTVRYETGDQCKDFDVITFIVNVVPETKFIGTGNGCVPLEVSFSDASGVLPAQSTWFFDGKDSINSIGIVSHVFSVAGCYDVTLKNKYPNGCYSEHTENVACAFALPEADFSWEPSVLDINNNTVTLFSEASSDVVFIEWDFLDSIGVFTHEMIGSSRVIDFNPIVKFVSNIDSGGIVNVSQTVVNSDGCRDSIIKPITVLDKFSVYVPNAFTPNDDGLNETFYPEGRNLVFGENYAFRIYNRWGTLIWISKVPGQAWDGRVTELVPSSGELAQIDVYVWRLDVIDPYTKDKIIKVGRVSLVK